MAEMTACRQCGTANAPYATMCIWCEGSLTGRPLATSTSTSRSANSVARGRPTALDAVVVISLVAVALACPVVVAILLSKQEAVDQAGRFYTGAGSHQANEFPEYGALSIIVALGCALTVYLIFRWITRLRNSE
jgi:ribosomal protein L40E